MTRLFDGNILIAMVLPEHPHHQRTPRWLASIKKEPFATCPITEVTLLRLHMHFARDPCAEEAWATLSALRAHPGHIFWADNFSYSELSSTRLTGHRQITDAWLAELARRRGGRLATLDESLYALWPDVTFLVPV